MTSLDSAKIAISCSDPDVFLLTRHFWMRGGVNLERWGCDRGRRCGFGTHVGRYLEEMRRSD